mgnify:CR=1 FL=1
MKTNSTQQEILLFTQTRFCHRMRFHPSAISQENGQAPVDLEDACWRGLIPEVLPEISLKKQSQSISLWEINKADRFIDLQFADTPRKMIKELSLNPYLFFCKQRLN